MTAAEEAAARLTDAAATRTPTGPVRDLLSTVDEAYTAQELVITAAEAGGANPRVGRKVGLTSPAVQAQLGVDQPDFGVLLAGMDVSAMTEVPMDRLLQPRIEAEVAFFLAHDVTDADPEKVRAAVGHVAPALEIVDSRVAGWDITIVDTVADNASSGLFVVGDARLTLDEVTPADVTMRMTVDGEAVSSGTGAACLGDPLNALVWVAETALRLGRPLRAGEVVLSGALGPMVPLRPGTRVEAVIAGLGTVTAVAGPARPENEKE